MRLQPPPLMDGETEAQVERRVLTTPTLSRVPISNIELQRAVGERSRLPALSRGTAGLPRKLSLSRPRNF